MALIHILLTLFVFLISSLPLYFAVKSLKGKTTLLKTVLVTFVTGIVVSAIRTQFEIFGGIIAFFVLIWIYHEVFRLKWIKAFLAWILQFVFIILFYLIIGLILAALLGVSLLALLL